MVVYAICLLKIHDHAAFEPYYARVGDIFKSHQGSMLAVEDAPTIIEGGQWPVDRTVLMSFPNEEAFRAWYYSPQYQDIIKYRMAGSVMTMGLFKGFDQRLLDGPPQPDEAAEDEKKD